MRSTRLALAVLALTAALASAATDDGPRVVVKRKILGPLLQL